MPAYRVRTNLIGVAGSPWMSNHYFDAATVGSANDAKGLVYNFWNAVDSYMANNVTWNIDQNVALFANPETLTGWEVVTAGTGQGLLSDAMLPIATQALVRWSTSAVYNNRRVRGRTFIPGLTVAANADGSLTTPTATAIATAADTMQDGGLVIPSRVQNAFIDVTGASVWSSFAVLRSRRD